MSPLSDRQRIELAIPAYLFYTLTGVPGVFAPAEPDMAAKAEADIAQERKKAVNEVKDEIGGIAMEIASKVVEREIREEDHRDLIDEFIKNVGEAS